MSADDELPSPPNGSAPSFLDNPSCQLLGPTALIVQGLMGVLVILSLVFKRHREKPMRPWRIWLFDVSKQVFGQLFIHGVNVLVSDLLSHHSSSNACVTYFLNILIDTTLGVALIYLILQVLTYLFTTKLGLPGFESGVYGHPPSFNFWIRQATLYVVALTTMKFLVIAFLALFPGLDRLAAWLLSWTWTDEGDSLQVIFTMGIFPIIMNILQFWLIDSIVKDHNVAVALDSAFPDALDHPDREPLFGVSSDDEDDDPRGHDLEAGRRPIPRSRSPPDSLSKTISSTSTPVEIKASGSTTPAPADGLESHSYPPSLSSSLTSTISSASVPSIREATKLNKKRRGPPSPLSITSPGQPAVNSPTVIQSAKKALKFPTEVEPKVVDAPASSSVGWEDSWDDSDDWANRVGEEEWTGRRLEEQKKNIHGVWESPGAHVSS